VTDDVMAVGKLKLIRGMILGFKMDRIRNELNPVQDEKKKNLFSKIYEGLK
jgi:hypothetical protein